MFFFFLVLVRHVNTLNVLFGSSKIQVYILRLRKKIPKEVT